MKKKRLISLVLASAMMTAMAVPAFAQDLAEGGTTSTDIVGTINATQLVVTVPATIAFQVDPTIDLASQAAIDAGVTGAQIVQPDNTKIQNGSAVPIYAKINSVAVSQTTGSDDVVLVNAATGLTAAKSMMFGIKDVSVVPTNFDTATDWLEKGDVTGNYLLSATGKMDASDGAENGTDELTLKIFGQTKNGWAAGDTFTITPTIMVSAQEDFGA